jgi:hypothetical protein
MSYALILKWAAEARAELRKRNLAAVRTNLTMIEAQCRDEIKIAAARLKRLKKASKGETAAEA